MTEWRKIPKSTYNSLLEILPIFRDCSSFATLHIARPFGFIKKTNKHE